MVCRNMRGDEARKLCPELMQVQVPTAHGKADLTHYRAAGKQVAIPLPPHPSVWLLSRPDSCSIGLLCEAPFHLPVGKVLLVFACCHQTPFRRDLFAHFSHCDAAWSPSATSLQHLLLPRTILRLHHKFGLSLDCGSRTRVTHR